ncbi:MAG TPA: hypothetical protein VHE33_21440 [Acidobacteriaceae bacterium]|jgi:hypothetical protein|nr:hypothetical protein [Acidobacteriaceae bacterium]
MMPANIECIEEGDIGGWISPDGSFFQAHYCEHEDVARQIIGKWLGEAYEGYWPGDYLVRRGWIRLETTGRIWHDFRPTPQQADMLYRCYVRGSDDYQGELYPCIPTIVQEAVRVRESVWSVPAQGDQENMNIRRMFAGRGISLYR